MPLVSQTGKASQKPADDILAGVSTATCCNSQSQSEAVTSFASSQSDTLANRDDTDEAPSLASTPVKKTDDVTFDRLTDSHLQSAVRERSVEETSHDDASVGACGRSSCPAFNDHLLPYTSAIIKTESGRPKSDLTYVIENTDISLVKELEASYSGAIGNTSDTSTDRDVIHKTAEPTTKYTVTPAASDLVSAPAPLHDLEAGSQGQHSDESDGEMDSIFPDVEVVSYSGQNTSGSHDCSDVTQVKQRAHVSAGYVHGARDPASRDSNVLQRGSDEQSLTCTIVTADGSVGNVAKDEEHPVFSPSSDAHARREAVESDVSLGQSYVQFRCLIQRVVRTVKCFSDTVYPLPRPTHSQHDVTHRKRLLFLRWKFQDYLIGVS